MYNELKLYDDKCVAVERAMKEFNINRIPIATRNRLYKSYRDDFLFAQEEFDFDKTVEEILNEKYPDSKYIREANGRDVVDIKHIIPVKKMIQTITGILNDVKDTQFKTVSHNGIESLSIRNAPAFWVQPMYGLIPNKPLNLDIIDYEMSQGGYVRTRCTPHKEKNSREWYFVVYNPDTKYLKSVRDLLLYDRFIHYSPEFNRDDILETGLVPSKGGRTYTYPDNRVFFYVYSYGGLSDSYKNMIRGISTKEKQRDYTFSGYFDCFELNTEKLPDNVKIYYDPNADDCVFLTIHIKPEWLIFKEKFSRIF